MARSRHAQPPFRVAYGVTAEVYGGVERHLATLVEHLDRVLYEPKVIGRAPETLRKQLDDLAVEFISVPDVSSKWDIWSWKAVFATVRRLEPHIFHGMQSQSFSGQYALASALLARVPRVLVTCHLPTPASNSLQHGLASALRRGVDVQIVPGAWAKAELARTGQLARRCVVVPNGIDKPVLVPRATARSLLGLPPDGAVVGCLMRLEPEKRADLVVGLARSLPGVTAVVFGDGPERTRLESLAAGSDVLLAGFRADAATLISALDVFVHPCPVDNQPLAILEAMASGIPVVVANEGGAADMVDHGRTGLLAPATAEGMAGAVRALLTDGALAGELAEAAIAHVAHEASADTMTRRVEALYLEDDDRTA